MIVPQSLVFCPFFEFDMNFLIIKLMVLAVATHEIYVEAKENHNDDNRELSDTIGSQKDILPGGIYENENYTPEVNHEKNYNYGKETRPGKVYNEVTDKPPNYNSGNRNNDNHARYKNNINRREYNRENNIGEENYKLLKAGYDGYQRDSRTFSNSASRRRRNERYTSTAVNTALPVPTNYPSSLNRYVSVPITRRIIVPVPMSTPNKLPLYQAPKAPYFVPYPVHPSVPYADNLQIPVSAALPVEMSSPNQYPVEVPHPVTVGFPQPILGYIPQPYYQAEYQPNTGYRDMVGEYSKGIRPNSEEPINNEHILSKQQENYDNGYSGGTKFKSVNSLSFERAQKPINWSNFRNTNSYFSHPSSNLPENSSILYGNSQRSLLNARLKNGRLYNAFNMNGSENIRSRSPFSTTQKHSRQGKTLNRNRNSYYFMPPCFFHRHNNYRN